MTTYNTGNPIGSPDPRDLYDNAQVIDDYANSAGDTTDDRLGVSRRTLAGMENEYAADKNSRDTTFDADQSDRVQRFNALLAASGYVFLADYAAGIEVTEYNEVIRDTAGNLWRASAGTDLPYTTTGAGLPEGGAFVSAGDAVLRNDLAAGVAIGQGALLVRGSVIYVDTIADLQALPVGELVDGQVVKTSYGAGFSWSATSNSWVLISPGMAESGAVITVGAGGEFASINSALDYIARLSGSEGRALDDGLELRLLSGFVMEEQVVIESKDFSWVRLTSDDATVTINRESLTQGVGTTGDFAFSPRYPAFAGVRGASLPRISCHFTMDALGDSYRRDGIYLAHDSSLVVDPGCGIDNTGQFGAFIIHGSRLTADRGRFDNCGDRSLYGMHSSTVSFRGGSAINSGWTAFQMHGSVGDCSSAVLTGAAHYGCRARNGASIDAAGVDVSGAADAGFNLLHGGHITAPNAIANDIMGEYGAILMSGCYADFTSATFQNSAGIAVRVALGSSANLHGADCSGSAGAHDVVCDHGSYINARNMVGTTNIFRNKPDPNGIISDSLRSGFTEEGTFAPEIRGSVTAGNHTYAGQAGHYIRVDNLVFVNMAITLSAKDPDMSGQVFIANLPVGARKLLSTPISVSRISGIAVLPSDFQGGWTGYFVNAGAIRLEYISTSGESARPTSELVGDNFLIHLSMTFFSDRMG